MKKIASKKSAVAIPKPKLKRRVGADDETKIQVTLPRHMVDLLRLAAGEYGGQTLNNLYRGIVHEWLDLRLEEVWQRRAERLEAELHEARRKPKARAGR